MYVRITTADGSVLVPVDPMLTASQMESFLHSRWAKDKRVCPVTLVSNEEAEHELGIGLIPVFDGKVPQ